MIKIEFGFGLELQEDGTHLSEDHVAVGLRQIRSAAVHLFGGCTLTRTVGDWRDPETGYTFSEHGATLSILTDGNGEPLNRNVKKLAENIKRSLNQKAVYVTRFSVQSKLY